MNLFKRIIPIKYGKYELKIRHITDIHIGAEGFHSDLFNSFTKIQEHDKDSFWICTGDIIDSDRPSTRDRKKTHVFRQKRRLFTGG